MKPGGVFDSDLISHIESGQALDKIKKITREKAYSARAVIEIEAAGFEVLCGLLEAFVSSVQEVATKGGNNASPKSLKLLQLVPDQFLGPERRPDSNLYEKLIKMTDYVSGMTDSFAVSLYKKISGISIPHS